MTSKAKVPALAAKNEITTAILALVDEHRIVGEFIKKGIGYGLDDAHKKAERLLRKL